MNLTSRYLTILLKLIKKFYGLFHEDNSFVFTSISKVAYSFEFEGTILQKDDGI